MGPGLHYRHTVVRTAEWTEVSVPFCPSCQSLLPLQPQGKKKANDVAVMAGAAVILNSISTLAAVILELKVEATCSAFSMSFFRISPL